MERFIPFEKLSKRKQRELTAKKRQTWGGLNPVTRKPENPKAYKREKARKWRDPHRRAFSFCIILSGYGRRDTIAVISARVINPPGRKEPSLYPVITPI